MSDMVWLVGDIGGTNARFGLVTPDGTLRHTNTYAVGDYPRFDDALAAYLEQRGDLPKPKIGCVAIAAQVTGDQVRMTNHPWNFTTTAVRDRLGFDRFIAINDFTAVALAVPRLQGGDRMQVGGGTAVDGTPIGVLGPGSGLGVSGLIRAGEHYTALSGEGGHSTMPAANDRENAVLARMRQHFDHVSAERCLSGPGLVNLYNSLAAVDGVPAASYSAAQITDPETAAADPLCREAAAMFCAMLGTVAGNLALTLGAKGGVYIAGGIVPRFGTAFTQTEFRSRFEAKGRLSPFLAAIPTYVVTHKLPAFLGCTAALAMPG
ncbi:MAG: glucokinase [Alphaproteobacteria bacterium]|nr:glucokinase [Alphaproteobacteria bacterium]